MLMVTDSCKLYVPLRGRGLSPAGWGKPRRPAETDRRDTLDERTQPGPTCKMKEACSLIGADGLLVFDWHPFPHLCLMSHVFKTHARPDEHSRTNTPYDAKQASKLCKAAAGSSGNRAEIVQPLFARACVCVRAWRPVSGVVIGKSAGPSLTPCRL